MNHIEFICPNCQHSLRLPRELVGQSGKCPKCQKHSIVVDSSTNDTEDLNVARTWNEVKSNEEPALDPSTTIEGPKGIQQFKKIEQHKTLSSRIKSLAQLTVIVGIVICVISISSTLLDNGNSGKDLVTEEQSNAENKPNAENELLELGVQKRDSGRLQEALVDFNKAIQLNPQVAFAYLYRGVTYGDLGEFENAIADYDKSIELAPTLVMAYYNRGKAHAALDEIEKAIADYTKAIELDPTIAQAYLRRGNTYYKLDENEKAIADYTKAIELDPNYA